MNQWKRNFVWASAVLLAYGLLVASWFGGRALPEVTRDLWLALRHGGEATLIVPLLVTFFSLYLTAVALLALWGLEQGGLRIWAPTYLVLGALGVLLAFVAFLRGADWQGAVTTLAGFWGAGVALWREGRQQRLSFEQAAVLAARAWAEHFALAQARQVPVAVAVCRAPSPLSARERQWLERELRAEDKAFFFLRGAILLLWDAGCAEALRAVARLREVSPFAQQASACCGVACFPQDGDTLPALIRHAGFAQELAAMLGRPVQQVADLQLPPQLAQLPEQPLTTTQLRDVVVLREAWKEIAQGEWQAFVIHFAPADLAAAIKDALRRMLRGADFFGRISPDRILVLLPETDYQGGTRMHEKLQHRLQPLAASRQGRLMVYRLAYDPQGDWETLLRAAYTVPALAEQG